jgi:thiol-disulfide isomerase/thioredoxin
MRSRLLLLTALAGYPALAGCQEGVPAQPSHRKLELVEAPATTDVAAYLAPLVVRADGDHKKLVVYVGASWCEPCRHFHDAAVANQLDDRFGDLRIVAFDADRDDAALEAAGYRSSMLPLFALPNADGRASGKQFAGSIKGDGAVAQIAPNLRALVDRH